MALRTCESTYLLQTDGHSNRNNTPESCTPHCDDQNITKVNPKCIGESLFFIAGRAIKKINLVVLYILWLDLSIRILLGMRGAVPMICCSNNIYCQIRSRQTILQMVWLVWRQSHHFYTLTWSPQGSNMNSTIWPSRTFQPKGPT